MPAAARHVWDCFSELDAARPVGWGAGPIDFIQIHAWSALTGASLRPWEVRAIRAMDTLRLQLAADGTPSAATDEPGDGVSDRPLTGALFDALFP